MSTTSASPILPAAVVPPSHLPDPDPLLEFDVDRKKKDIFEAARERIKNKAQYTRRGRKPWTQIVVTLPIRPSTTDEQDLAVVWALMRECTRSEAKEIHNGDLVWTLRGCHEYLKWLNVDFDRTKPADKFVHPVLYETGARKGAVLEDKLRKARRSGAAHRVRQIERELEEYESVPAASRAAAATTQQPSGEDYHWSIYDECVVTYEKKQTRKAANNELQLTVKIRTSYLGCGDPKENNGYLGGGCRVSEGLLDPESKLYELMKTIGM